MSCNCYKIETTSQDELVKKVINGLSKEANINYSKVFDILAVIIDEGYDIGTTVIYCDFITDFDKKKIKYTLTRKDLDLESRFGILGYYSRDYVKAKKWFVENK